MRSACVQLMVLWMAIAILPGAMASNARRPAAAPVRIPQGDPLADELPLSPAERRVFADASDGSLDEGSLLTAALVACGMDDAAAIARCRSVFDAAGSEVSKRAENASTTTERIEIIHRVLHDRLLRGGYDANATDLAETLRTGIYNCAAPRCCGLRWQKNCISKHGPLKCQAMFEWSSTVIAACFKLK